MRDIPAEVATNIASAEEQAARAFVEFHKRKRKKSDATEALQLGKQAYAEALLSLERDEPGLRTATLATQLRSLQIQLEQERKECKAIQERAEEAFHQAIEMGHDGSDAQMARKCNAIAIAYQDLVDAKNDYKLRVSAIRDAMRAVNGDVAAIMIERAKQLSLF